MGRSGVQVTARRTARALSAMTRAGSRAGYRTIRFTGATVHRMTHASGAGRTGLANLIELTGASSAGDAFVAVALAGTLFFSASLDQARGRVALALVVTMAPFAVLAPLIGPMLDRVQQGRRFVLAGTLVARGLLCWGMAAAVAYNDALTLLPAAFAVLVLQKAYGVTRAAITPRLLPREITLVTANARISMASLIAGTVSVGTAAGIDFAAGGGDSGAAWVLRVGTFVYLAAAALSFRVPEKVDVPEQHREAPLPGAGAGAPGAATRRPAPARPAPRPGGPTGTRAGRREPGHGADGHGVPPGRWRTLSRVGPVVGEAIRVNATLRAFSGFMVFFLAFLLRIEHFPGVSDKIALGAMIVAAGAGGFLGTAAGSALRPVRPHLITFGILAAATVTTGLCAAFFGLWAALVVALVAAFGQVLGKLALDSAVQNQIREEIRSSTFAASETLHQLSWVAGALAGLAMSFTSSGVAGLTVAAVGLAISLTLLLGQRRRRALASR